MSVVTNMTQAGNADDEQDEAEDEFLSALDYALSQILRDPPRTGETYGTIQRAVAIINGVPASSHADAKARFHALRKAGQIEFVTLEAKLGVNVDEQVNLGTLFRAPDRVNQIADFSWNYGGARWIGDAKWKLLGDKAPGIEETETVAEIVRAGAISPADARQLSVYALLLQQQQNLATVPATVLLYPMLGAATPQRLRSWNGADLQLWPVRVRGVAAARARRGCIKRSDRVPARIANFCGQRLSALAPGAWGAL